MRKLIALTIGLVMLILVPSLINAKSDKNQGQGSNKPTVSQNNPNKTGNEEEEGEMSPSELAKTKSAAKKLLKINEVVEDPEVEEEVEDLAEEEEQIESNAEEAIEEADQRPSAVRFLIGPDYKNLGQLRSEIVHLRNNIRQLERIQVKAGEDEQPAIEAAILELEETASGLQAEMYQKLANFSLFGWLFRWFIGFTPPEDGVTPTVTVTPTVSGEPTVTPNLSPTVTMTPTVTVIPTETPTPTPTI